jgi:hypothetical protein
MSRSGLGNFLLRPEQSSQPLYEWKSIRLDFLPTAGAFGFGEFPAVNGSDLKFERF